MHELRAYNSFSKLQHSNKTTLSTRNKPKGSFSPTPSRSRVKTSKNYEVDLTSTILDMPKRSDRGQSELEIVKKKLQHAENHLTEITIAYENKLKNAEFIIELLRDEIKGQLKGVKEEILTQRFQQSENNSAQWENRIEALKSEYEEKIKRLQKEKLCTKCKAFLEISKGINEKKKFYKYLY